MMSPGESVFTGFYEHKIQHFIFWPALAPSKMVQRCIFVNE
jgi:hypothetical protein